MKDRGLELALLFDFFGELLTERQREYFELYHNQDLSLSEIAENEGISRQGVRDIIVRAEGILTETEKKTGVVEKYLRDQADIAAIDKLLEEMISLMEQGESGGRLLELATAARGRLQSLRG